MATTPQTPRSGVQMFQRQQALNNQLKAAKTLAEYNKIIETARAEKLTLDTKLVQQTQATLQKADMAAKSKTYQDQQAKLTADKAAADAKAKADAIAKASAANAAAVAKTQAAADAKTKADAAKAAAEKVNADRLAAQVAADAKRDADRLAARAVETPEQRAAREARERIQADPRALVAKSQEIQNQLLRQKTTAGVDDLVKQAKEFGITLNQGLIDRSRTIAGQAETGAVAQQQAAKAAELTKELQASRTQAQFDAVMLKAKDQGVALNQGQVENTQQAVRGLETRAAAEAQAAKVTDFETRISSATSQEQITDLANQAKAAGLTINPGITERASSQIKNQTATAEFAKGLGTPTGFQNRFSPTGQEFVSLADDPITGTKGGWYQLSGGGMQQVGTDGRPTGAVVPLNAFNQQQAVARENVAVFQQRQKAETAARKLAEDKTTFEANLPKPGTEEFKYNLANRYAMTGPDGSNYEILPSGWVSSAKGSNTYTPVGQPDAGPVSKQQINQVFQTRAAEQNAQVQAQRQALIAKQTADRNASPVGELLADFDKMVNNTVGWKTVATIAGSIVGGPLGATFANAAAGAIGGDSIENIAKSAALTFALSYGTQALSRAISQGIDTGLQTGALPADNTVYQFADDVSSLNTTAQAIDDVYQLGDLPQSVIDLAMTTDDPIAALNAAQGFGNVDPAYLQQIGATDDLIAVAEAHNTVNGFTGGGGGFVGSEYSSIPSEFYGPPAELAQGPVQPNYGFSPAELEAISQGKLLSENPLPGVQYASTEPISNISTTNLTNEQVYERLVNQGVNPTEAYNTVYGTAPSTGFGPQQLAEETLLNMAPTTTPVVPDVINPGAGISTPGAVIPNIPTEVLVAAPVVIGGALAAGGGGGGGAAATTAPTTPFLGLPGPEIAPPVPVKPAPAPIQPVQPPVAEVTPSPGGDIIDGVQTPANPTQPVPAPQPSPPVPDLPIPPVIVPPQVVAPPVPVTPPAAPVQPPVVEPPQPGPAQPGPAQPGTGTGTGTGGPPGGSSEVLGPDTGLVREPPTQPTYTPGGPGQAPVTAYETPYQGEYSNDSVLERYMKGGISFDGITKLIAAGLVLPSVLGLIAGQPQGPTIKRPNYGPIPAINWGGAGGLVMPGVNPGFVINPAQQPFYQTTDPVQAKYAYTQRPLVTRPEDVLSTYQDRQYAPAVPWGLQQGQQQYDLAQVLNQINTTPQDPNFVGYSNYPTQGYQPPIFNPGQAVNQAQYIPAGYSPVMGPIAPG